jgi:PDZ domain-containing protein
VTSRSTPQLLAGVLIAVGLALAITLPVPYVVASPGPVINVLGTQGGAPLITISGAPTYPTAGQLDLTTVSERGGPGSRVNLVYALSSALDEHDAVVPRDLLYPPDQTADQVATEGSAQMTQSQDAAAIAALRHLHLPVTLYADVTDVQKGAPADGKLMAGDVIRTVDGTTVTSAPEVTAAVRKRKPGDTVVFGVLRKGAPLSESMTATAAPDDPKRAYLGIGVGNGYTSPVKVSIKLDDVGGPSGGLMFTMGIVDKLTPEQVNRGQHVAGTGTMDENGNVGAIGGIRQKIAAAKADGATVFLVPAANCSEAVVGAPPGLQLVKVSTLDGALTALDQAVSGGAAPHC